MKPPQVVAEIGCNHKGDMAIAREMIMVAASFCKADVVKFQKRHARELLTEAQYAAPHPNPMHAYGPTYGAHREALEFNAAQHRQLKAWCEEFGTQYSTSVWDITSAKDIAPLNPALIKIPSACNLHWHLLGHLCDHYGGEIHISFGMTTHAEEEQVVQFFESKGRAKDLVLYSCTSGYPVAFEDICLLEITRLIKAYGSRVKEIGFSGHHLGIAADIA
ncbi:MAG TPA: N-acetylneuraminate synthase family protein, partial [Verrucomicrobiota bacterium]|nr:N-acetylneuraminate synthase family protein [Verrucomicrobiota bacterium]